VKKLKVLVVDDSVVYRTQVKSALELFSHIEAVVVASNGAVALEKLKQGEFDFIVLDLEMPIMDGITTIKQIKSQGIKTKIIVFSSISTRAAQITMEALSLGADDFVTKPGGDKDQSLSPRDFIHGLLRPKVLALFPDLKEKVQTKKDSFFSSAVNLSLFIPEIVVIGSSTGGPAVLEKIFSNLKGPLNCPIVISQHMPPVFTTSLAQRLSKLSGLNVVEAKHLESVNKNQVYIAPGDYHLRLVKQGVENIIELKQDEKINYVRPAVDPLFESASLLYGKNCLGLVLTGMGQDGKQGAQMIKEHGGVVFIQDEASCVVFGMPGAVFQAGFYDRILNPEQITDYLYKSICQRSVSNKNSA
jgi:two-component system, chemotaxis family, protein-glutamate methylesterase/glutaminase